MSDPSAFTPLAVPRVGATPTDVRGEADKARTRGYAEGFAEGRRIALEEARRRELQEEARMQDAREAQRRAHASALAALQSSQDEVERRIGELSELAADRIEDLAVSLATAILGVELSDPARSAAHALRRALAEMPAERWTRIAFHEADWAVLSEDEGGLDPLRGIRVVTSPDVDPGGAIVDIEHGAVDTRISQALARASAALRGDDVEAAGAVSRA
ncbi:FliH/SctL family protein [Microbacterium sp. 179-I 3D4 NHS]|uniref:FliH/SctL family protein n=1 Tax=Microbacterium sp. 179-I 3D4 NHS TaxID=3142381 RepID=UPI0039A31626